MYTPRSSGTSWNHSVSPVTVHSPSTLVSSDERMVTSSGKTYGSTGLPSYRENPACSARKVGSNEISTSSCACAWSGARKIAAQKTKARDAFRDMSIRYHKPTIACNLQNVAEKPQNSDIQNYSRSEEFWDMCPHPFFYWRRRAREVNRYSCSLPSRGAGKRHVRLHHGVEKGMPLRSRQDAVQCPDDTSRYFRPRRDDGRYGKALGRCDAPPCAPLRDGVRSGRAYQNDEIGRASC